MNALFVTVHFDKRANLRNGDALLVAERDGLVEREHEIEAFLRHLVFVRRLANVGHLHTYDASDEQPMQKIRQKSAFSRQFASNAKRQKRQAFDEAT